MSQTFTEKKKKFQIIVSNKWENCQQPETLLFPQGLCLKTHLANLDLCAQQ